MNSESATIGPRALGGGSLEGSRLMRLVYLDETGISQGEPTVVVAGVIVDADKQLSHVETALANAVKQWIPADYQENFVFHAKEIFNGGGKVFNRENFSLDNRLLIADHLVSIIIAYELPIVFGLIEKKTYPRSQEWRKQWELLPIKEQIASMHTEAFMGCSMCVEKYMRDFHQDEVCMLVVENNDQARTMLKDIHVFSQTQEARDIQDPHWQWIFPFRKIKEDPLFQGKKSYSPMQLADLVAYIIKKALAEDERYWPIFSKIMPFIAANPIPADRLASPS